jgi:hypothetical protein
MVTEDSLHHEDVEHRLHRLVLAEGLDVLAPARRSTKLWLGEE